MPTYKVDISQTVIESTTLYVQAHDADQAELIGQWIAENGKDPGDRKFIDVTWRTDEIQDEPEAIACTEDNTLYPCNLMPEHTQGLWKDDAEDNAA